MTLPRSSLGWVSLPAVPKITTYTVNVPGQNRCCLFRQSSGSGARLLLTLPRFGVHHYLYLLPRICCLVKGRFWLHRRQTFKMAGQFQLKRKSSICIRIEEERGDVYSATRSNSRNSDVLRKQLGEADGEGSSDDPKTKTLQRTQEYNTGQDDDTDILSLSDSDTIQLEVSICYLATFYCYGKYHQR